MRRRPLMWLLYVLAALLLLVAGLWAMLTQPVPGSPEQCSAPAVDPERLVAHVRMLSEELWPRGWSDEANLGRVADYVRAQLEASGAELHELAVEEGEEGVQSRVVIARYGPDTQAVLVVGAHYDAWGGHPGADDNASGVAGLLELGRLLGRERLTQRVELVAYPNEEPPHFRSADMGSAQHVRALKQAGKQITAMICLEMLGTFSDEADSQQFPLPQLRYVYPSTGNYIVVVGKLGWGGLVREVKRAMRGGSDLPVHSINAPRWVPGIDFSDHASYWDEGVDAVMVTDTAFYRNPRYHTGADTWEKLDYLRMAKVVQGLWCAVRALAGER